MACLPTHALPLWLISSKAIGTHAMSSQLNQQLDQAFLVCCPMYKGHVAYSTTPLTKHLWHQLINIRVVISYFYRQPPPFFLLGEHGVMLVLHC